MLLAEVRFCDHGRPQSKPIGRLGMELIKIIYFIFGHPVSGKKQMSDRSSSHDVRKSSPTSEDVPSYMRSTSASTKKERQGRKLQNNFFDLTFDAVNKGHILMLNYVALKNYQIFIYFQFSVHLYNLMANSKDNKQ